MDYFNIFGFVIGLNLFFVFKFHNTNTFSPNSTDMRDKC